MFSFHPLHPPAHPHRLHRHQIPYPIHNKQVLNNTTKREKSILTEQILLHH